MFPFESAYGSDGMFPPLNAASPPRLSVSTSPPAELLPGSLTATDSVAVTPSAPTGAFFTWISKPVSADTSPVSRNSLAAHSPCHECRCSLNVK